MKSFFQENFNNTYSVFTCNDGNFIVTIDQNQDDIFVELNKEQTDLLLNRLLNNIKEWQNWWNEVGYEWYGKLEHPYDQKPNFLKQKSPFYHEWIVFKDN